MAKPNSGDRLEHAIKLIRNQGIDKIVSLLEIHESDELGLARENEFVINSGMEFDSFPIQDGALPNSFIEYRDFTEQLFHEASSGKNLVVHCNAGIGRSGMVAAGVLIHCDFKPGAAFDYICACRGIEVPDTPEQKRWVISNFDLTAEHSEK